MKRKPSTLSAALAVLLLFESPQLLAQTPTETPGNPSSPVNTPFSSSDVVPPPIPSVRPTPNRRNRNRPNQAMPVPPPPTESTPSPMSDANQRPFTQNERGLVKLDFPNAEISDVAKAISELTQKNFLLDERVRGKITIMSPNPVTVDEAYQAFVSALEVKNFTIIRIGKIYKIVELRDMKSLPIGTDSDVSGGASDIFVTKMMPLEFIKASEIVKSLRGLVTKNGDMISYDATNTLIITDTVANLRRLKRIIDRLDQPSAEENLEVVKLKYSAASDIAEKVRKIFDIQDRPPGQPAQPNPADAKSDEVISKIIPDDRTNTLIVLANKSGFRRLREVIAKIDQAVEREIGNGKIHVHYLQYADASELATTLTSLAGGGRGGTSRKGGQRRNTTSSTASSMFTRAGGNPPPPPLAPDAGAVSAPVSGSLDIFGGEVLITADVPTNALVITAAPADYQALLPIINKLDARRPQAFIEAMILEVDIDKALNFGVAGNLGTQFGNPPTTVYGATTLGGISSLSIPAPPPQGLIAGFQGHTIDIPVAGGQTVKIPVYATQLQALQQSGTVNILSTPNILTTDNTEAEIIVGQEVPFTTSQITTTQGTPNAITQFQRQDVAITLRVTPQINESDDITMNIFQEIQDLVESSLGNVAGPTTTKRSAKTTVLVKDSQTVTVGGLIADVESIQVTKVPVLGDIPILGWLFKSKSKKKRKTSLVIFITPHIIREPEDMERMSVRANDQRQRFMKENNIGEHPGLAKYDLDKELRVPPKKEGEALKSDEVIEVPTPKPTNKPAEEGK